MTSVNPMARPTAASNVDTLADLSSDELQRRLDERRRSISRNMSEVKSTVNAEYQQTRSTLTEQKENFLESIDWRTQVQRHPVAACAGVLVLGLVLGNRVRAQMDSRDEIDFRGFAANNTPGAASRIDPDISNHTRQARSGPQHPMEQHSAPSEPGAVSQFANKLGNRSGSILNQIIDQVLDEVQKVGREVVVPSLLAMGAQHVQRLSGGAIPASAITAKLQNPPPRA